MKPISRISFEGQVGLVTGAAGGLGLAYSRLLAERGIHLAAQVYEGRVLVRKLLQELALGAADEGRDPARDLGGVVDHDRVGEHRDRVLRDGELDPVAVGDRAAAGIHGDVLDLLRDRPVGQVTGADRAEPGCAQGGEAEQDQEKRE